MKKPLPQRGAERRKKEKQADESASRTNESIKQLIFSAFVFFCASLRPKYLRGGSVGSC
jgi:hypothetical protein